VVVPGSLEVLITCIAGLPGSGKTHLMDEISAQYPPLRAWAVDDITELGQLPGVHAVFHLDHLIIADPHFCRESTRVRAETLLTGWYNRPIEWIFFENNPQRCRENVHCRNDQRRVLGMIHILSQLYTIPAGADVRPVYCRIDS
jgi:hypothetical protein